MSEGNLHPNVLAKKICDWAKIQEDFSFEKLLETVPELYAPQALADQVLINYEDARMALDSEWDRSDEGFALMKDNCALLYTKYTGININDAVEELNEEFLELEDDTTATVTEIE